MPPRPPGLVRLGLGIYAEAAIGAFVIPTAAGDAMTRLGTYAGVLIVVAWRPRCARPSSSPDRGADVAVEPRRGAITTAAANPSSHPAYSTPLVGELHQISADPVQIEIPFTAEH